MNWLGVDRRSLVGMVLGAVLGVVVYGVVVAAGTAAPWLVGLCAGLGAALPAREKSHARGLVVAALAVWAGAVAQVVQVPGGGADVVVGLARFHETLDGCGGVAHVVSALLAFAFGGTSFRRGAGRRITGA